MDFSKLKLEVYDFLALALPGLIVIGEGWVFLRGWTAFAISVNQLSGAGFTLLGVFAFALGHLVQEFGDAVIKASRGNRFFKRARDRFWVSEEAKAVKAAIKDQSGVDIAFVDTAFDYCLSKLKDGFAKRDVFIATSDLSRSLAVLSILAILPTLRAAIVNGRLTWNHIVLIGIEIALLISLAGLAWKRMVRFRELSETTVFRAFMAQVKETLESDQIAREPDKNRGG